MIITNSIYIRAGREIYAKRKSLREFSSSLPDPLPIIEDPFQSTKTTEISITSEQIRTPSDSFNFRISGPSHLHVSKSPQRNNRNAYTVIVSSSQQASIPQPVDLASSRFSFIEDIGGLKDHGTRSQGLLPIYKSSLDRLKPYHNRRNAVIHQADSAAWAYTKVAVLFFVAMMVTWIPSSANRVYSVVHPGEISIGLSFASAFVLPLQGFWNALIYTTTSLRACKAFWRDITSRSLLDLKELRRLKGRSTKEKINDRGNNIFAKSDSMTELAIRPDTKGSSS